MLKRTFFSMLILALPAGAQQRGGTVRNSPFVAGTARAYDADGTFVATIRESPFLPGERRIYDANGADTGIELRDSPFLEGSTNVYGDRDE